MADGEREILGPWPWPFGVPTVGAEATVHYRVRVPRAGGGTMVARVESKVRVHEVRLREDGGADVWVEAPRHG